VTDDTLIHDGINDVINYARAGERLLSVAGLLANTATALKDVVELDAALAPEMMVALDALTEASDAIKRALTFLDARHQAKWGRA